MCVFSAMPAVVIVDDTRLCGHDAGVPSCRRARVVYTDDSGTKSAAVCRQNYAYLEFGCRD